MDRQVLIARLREMAEDGTALIDEERAMLREAADALAAVGMCGHTVVSPPKGFPPLVCELPAGHDGPHQGYESAQWTPRTPKDFGTPD